MILIMINDITWPFDVICYNHYVYYYEYDYRSIAPPGTGRPCPASPLSAIRV